MTVHIGEMTSEISVVEGDLPLTTEQIDKLVKLVMSRIEARKREMGQQREAVEMRSRVSPPLVAG